MYSNPPFGPSSDSTDNMLGSAAHEANESMSRDVAQDAASSLSGNVQDIRHHSPALDRAAHQASALAQRGADAVRDGSQQIREKALRASETTVKYVKAEPVKAMMIAAASGAALMALASMKSRSRHRT